METVSEYEESALDHPAIGVIATGDNTDAIVRVAALAREHGHAVFVGYDGRDEPESARLARQLGAETVATDDGSGDEDVLRNVVATMARARGFPGLLFHDSPEECINYERSREAFRSSAAFTVPAPTRDSASETDADVLVAIPAYNEAGSIGEVVRSVRRNADTVLVVDDGSADDTAAVAEAAGAEVVQHETNGGYGAALKTAFVEAHDRGVEHLVTIDGDGQHNADDIARLIECQDETGAEVLIGSRFVGDARTDIPLYRRFGLSVVNVLTNLSLGVVKAESRVSDTQSGFRAYDERAIESLAQDRTLGDHMSISTDILYHAQQRGYRIEEVGTVIDYDVEGASSHNPVSHGYVLVMNLLNTIERTRPLTALALPGSVLTFIGVGFGYWGFLHYIQASYFPVSRAVLAAFFIFVGLLVCLVGIILHSLNKYFDKVPAVETDPVR
ncbi:glycosyltransferase family 2 protein [Halorussus marinus]|uniref:glycosyltransferase family 2 protein n=1 Tax=Halorussus marinus TaxID=2505976 RepID=UPI00106ED702|nr:glycosyltransferase family 2 protein [Halorussus marinus]